MRRPLPWLFSALLIAAVIASAIWLLQLPAARFFLRTELTPAPSSPTSSDRQAPSQTAEPAPYDAVPTAHAGEPITIELTEPPAERYASATQTSADASYAALVARLNRPDVVFDPALGKAARELAMQQSLLIGLVPQDVVDFLLRSAGAVDRTVEQGFTATSGDGAEAAGERLRTMIGPPGSARLTTRVGIGEVWIPGAKLSRVIAVLLSRREIEVDSTPRAVDRGDVWTLAGALPRGYESPSALVLRPDGKLEEAGIEIEGESESAGRRFRVTVPAGDVTGTLHVSVGAVGPGGPTTLVQLPVEVGQPLPQTYSTRLPPDESTVKTPEAAESLAFDLLNADRARFGLPRLTRDRNLDAIARAHSADMRDHGFFGHVSPTTGGPGDRLTAARYRSTAYAENVATEGSLHGAEANLLASLGHRRNILSPDLTHVGIGVAGREREERTDWHVTQLFARPVVVIDANAEADRLRAALSARRRAAGVPGLARDLELDRVARDHARAAAEGKLDGLGKRALGDADQAGLMPGKAQVWIYRTVDPSGIEPPAIGEDAAYTRAGIGIAQAVDDPNGWIGVVLLLASDPR